MIDMIRSHTPTRKAVKSAPTLIMILPLVLIVSTGCSGGSRYVPSALSGRQALEEALNAWQNGQPVGRIETGSTPVQVVDSVWSSKQKLASYEILEEVTREDGRRCFKVRLNLHEPPVTQEVNYVVTGISPLWVFREEDYNGFQNWGGAPGKAQQVH